MSRFLSALITEEVPQKDGISLKRLTAPLVYQSDLLGKTITVPVGFVTDYASVPRIPFVYDILADRGDAAATLHDWLYTLPHDGVSRKQADGVLKEALEVQGVPAWMAWQFYIGVRIGGRSHWQ